jgi:hypothetical protein
MAVISWWMIFDSGDFTAANDEVITSEQDITDGTT